MHSSLLALEVMEFHTIEAYCNLDLMCSITSEGSGREEKEKTTV
jgi:hypothetical protein